MDGWSGHLLIAPAWMTDPNFSRVVVLLLDHDERGAFGLVLNRPTGTTVGEVWREAAGKPCEVEAPLLLGGPVSGPIIALHDREEDGDRPLLDGLFATSSPARLAALMERPPLRLRVFAGYAGWGRGQLEQELQDAAWVVTPAVPEDVFSAPGPAAWEAALHRATQAAAADPFLPEQPPPAPRADVN